jgi:hypothetical protein
MAKSQCVPVSQATEVMVEYMKDERFEDSLARVTKHFDGWECHIQCSYNENDEFRSLCEDYAACARSLENWQASDAAVAVQRQNEYAELLAELKQEIHNWLDEQYVHDQSDSRAMPRRDPNVS